MKKSIEKVRRNEPKTVIENIGNRKIAAG